MTSRGAEKMTEITIGVDISKDALDVYRLSDGAKRQFANTAKGYKALIAWMGRDVARVVFEPTGPYHRDFERALANAGLPLAKVNPRQVRRFAEAAGKLAKTDSLDAALLARMGAALQLEVRPACDEAIAELKQLHLAREALIKDRTAAKNRAKALSLAVLKRQNADRLKHVERQLAAIEDEIESRIQADADLARRFDILTSIPGVARLTAFALLIEMPELGALEAKQAASLAGLAPVARQSGRWTGKAYIRGGRPNVRRALYMPALVAMRFNPDLKAKYDQLISAGKPAKVAITAIMRKLVVMANALLKAGRSWEPREA
jgi:transposase